MPISGHILAKFQVLPCVIEFCALAPDFFIINFAAAVCKMVPSNVDPELCFRHDGHLVCMMTKHVDDLKIT
jgi:hypothetical protein